jgi:hypothetical protein
LHCVWCALLFELCLDVSATFGHLVLCLLHKLALSAILPLIECSIVNCGVAQNIALLVFCSDYCILRFLDRPECRCSVLFDVRLFEFWLKCASASTVATSSASKFLLFLVDRR